jgi:AcrR family transcriptional regulator
MDSSMPTVSTAPDVKERIIAAASIRFVEEGSSPVPLDEIAGSLGISKKTFYKHFKSKDELLVVVTDRLLAEVHAEFRSIAEAETGFLEKFESLVTFLGARFTRLSKPMMRDLQRHSPHIWARVEKFRRERISTDFRGLLMHGVAEGYVRGDVDIDLFLLAFIGAVEAVVNPAVLAGQSLSVREIIRSIMTVFLRGILTGPALEEYARLQSRGGTNRISQPSGVS